ncbi:MAG: phosphoribosylformylglycinamidine synthase, partial [Candidatus Methylumidiphilus sp.]
ANSEHCRHKIFNATWTIDGQSFDESLFSLIKNTYKCSPNGILSAYKDNASVIEGHDAEWFYVDPKSKTFKYHPQSIATLMKVETHNHPTAIAPFSGAATGSGGEIRDEGATGRGSKPKAGLGGFCVSHLEIPGFIQDWESAACMGRPSNMASPLEIMLQGPIGAAAFNNEFGRPNICGYFRTFGLSAQGTYWGYHKPIMIAGGLGNIQPALVEKDRISVGSLIIVLGGPAMKIGIGGGAASSVSSGSQQSELDFASVQRENPEMQRRAQQVIDGCWTLGENNPIIAIHDVGAGGLCNALPELVNDAGRGAKFDLRKIPIAESGMSPLDIWCNESQERYVLAINPKSLDYFSELCERERCPFAVLGTATEETQLTVSDDQFANKPVDMPLSVLLGKTPKMHRVVDRIVNQKTNKDVIQSKEAIQSNHIDLNLNLNISFEEALKRVLHFPCVADKSFLITIGDRSVGGLIAQDQMVGPWQIPVADCGVTHFSFKGFKGEAMAMGERPSVALINAAASARLAVTESITNLLGADIKALSDIRLSGNWMAAPNYKDEGAKLYDAVYAIGKELCPALGIAIPVGKDSLSMQTKWTENGQGQTVVSPVSVV